MDDYLTYTDARKYFRYPPGVECLYIADGLDEAAYGPCANATQVRFELGEGHLERFKSGL